MKAIQKPMSSKVIHAISGLAFAFACLSAVANAKLKTDSETAKPVFINAKTGAQVDAVEAVKASMSGDRIFKCQEVEPVANSRSGNISLKKKQ